VFKFAGVADGEGLPPDAELVRIVEDGLHGTAMLPWDVPANELNAIIQYIKTFSPEDEGFRDPEEEIGTPITPPEDPWAWKVDEAVALGSDLYHGKATCWSCHPAYVTRKEIHEASTKVGTQPITSFRDDLYFPEAKPADAIAVAGHSMKILPPDFTFTPVRSATDPAGLFRVIGSGIQGTAMPKWHGVIPDDQLFALAYYVDSLIKMKGTPEAQALRTKLMSQGDWTPPQPESDEGEENGEAETEEE